MKKTIVSLAVLLNVISFCGLPAAPDRSAKDKMLSDLDVIHNAFEVGYAPKEWKQSYAGWNLDVEILKAKEKIQTTPIMTPKIYQHIIRNFFNSTKDYHVSVTFWSTESATLPFLIKEVNGKYFISHIDSEKLSPSIFSIHVGDELISFDGVPIDEAFQMFLKNEVRNATEATDRGYAEFFFTHRLGTAGHVVPRGPVMVGIKSIFSEKVKNHQLIWTYAPEKITNHYKSILDKPKSKPSLNEKSDVLHNAVARHHMLSPLYELKKAAPGNLKMAPGTLGVRESCIPELGKIWWKSDNSNFFHSYLYENDQKQLIGYIRIPHYIGFEGDIKEFEQIIQLFEERADALVIDQIDNPGGFIFFTYALASMLTDQPLITPRHRMAITQDDVAAALNVIPIFEKIDDDAEAVEIFGETFFGFPVSHQMIQFFLNYFNFIVSEWNAGRTLTEPYFLYSLDRINPHPYVQFSKPILLVINSMDISCGDFFPAIMQDNKKATLFGTRTAGAGGYVNAMSFPNRHGIQFFSYTGSIAERIDTNPIENLGVTPDIPYAITEEDVKFNYSDYAKAINESVNKLVEKPVKAEAQ